MQPERIQITEDDIAYSEKILLDDGHHFDDERIAFIKNFETADVQAVPGSGKTTALLAKLLILERYLPFSDGSGILVISHTNTAIDEIIRKIGKHCPKLFTYPNFIGTIQSFVDQFLAIPFYCKEFKNKPHKIDTEIYKARHYTPGRSAGWLSNQPNKDVILRESRLFNEDELGYLSSNTEFPLKDKGTETYKGILALKQELRIRGILSYEDAYILAMRYVSCFPKIITLISKRFPFVFVDEMQDMEKHQHDLLESLFNNEAVRYQRIGDKNQAIYSGRGSMENIWQERNKVLPINGSHRLSSKIVSLVNNFAVDTTYKIEGRGASEVDPVMIVFSKDSIGQVIPKFADLVESSIPSDALSKCRHPIKVIGWRKTAENGSMAITSYAKDYNPEAVSSKILHPSLKSHVVLSKELSNQTSLLNGIRKSILEAFVTILRKENVMQEGGRYFSVDSLYKFLKENNKPLYDEFKLNIFTWCKDIYKGKTDETLLRIKEFIPKLLLIFEKTVEKSAEFINGDNICVSSSPEAAPCNLYNCPTINRKIEIGTVHSAKGETHIATLYLETFYKGKSESERLSDYFCGRSRNSSSNNTEKESLKIAYVAMSRPTHLLCFAIERSRFERIKSDISGWTIVELDCNEQPKQPDNECVQSQMVFG